MTITLNLPLAAANCSPKEQGPRDSCSLVLRLNPSIRLERVRKGLLGHENAEVRWHMYLPRMRLSYLY